MYFVVLTVNHSQFILFADFQVTAPIFHPVICLRSAPFATVQAVLEAPLAQGYLSALDGMVRPMFSGLIFVDLCLFANRHFCHSVLANLRFVLPLVLIP